MKFPWKELLDWYAARGRRGLPWREYASWKPAEIGYPVWVAEVMLQQTQVDRGAKFFSRFLARFPTVRDLASTTWEEVFPYWDGLGYYSRGRRMIATAQAVVENFDGVFPDDPEKLATLPGVGPYTARSVTAFAYGKPYLSWDVNLQKVFARYFFGRKDAEVPERMKGELERGLGRYLAGVSKPGGERDGSMPFSPAGRKAMRPGSEPGTTHGRPGRDGFALPGFPSGRDVNNALMDFGSLVSLGDAAKVDFGAYPLPGCKFAATRGKAEKAAAKRKIAKRAGTGKSSNISAGSAAGGSPRSAVPAKSRRIAVVLHENGKVFFSPKKSGWEPFVLPPATGDHRAAVKAWFAQKHGLTLSVRPPFAVSESPAPTVWYRAQVQAGTPKFAKFGKDAVRLPEAK